MTENIPKLVGEALHESADLAQKEFALFRTEMSDNVRTIAMGLVMVIAAALIAIGLGLYGRNAMAKTSLAPTRTAQSLQRDKEVLTERASG